MTADLNTPPSLVIIIKISASDTFKPLKSRDYFDHDAIFIFYCKNTSGESFIYCTNGSSLTSPVDTTFDQPLSAFTGDTYIFIKDANISGVDPTEKDESIRQILLDENLKISDTFKDTK